MRVQHIQPSFRQDSKVDGVKKPTTPQLKFLEVPQNENILSSSLDLDKPQNRDQKRLMEKAKLKEGNKAKSFQKEVFEVELPSKKGVNIWVERSLEFKEHSIEIG